MPRLVRRKTLRERVAAWLNPMDVLLWASEEIQTRGLDSQAVGTRVGLALNVAYCLTVANSNSFQDGDDLFDESSSSSWFGYLLGLLWLVLLPASAYNAIATFTKTRKYRLFEADVETRPKTTSAQRVRVQSSPTSSSPLRLLATMLTPESAEARAHPDITRDVWELRIWDPVPAQLQIFCLFNPAHILAYAQFLPLTPMETRPSIRVFSCLVIQASLSVVLLLMKTWFSQQVKDMSVLHKEVFHEYDTKYVHPQLHPVVRDVGTQFSHNDAGRDLDFVEQGTPTTLLRRGFRTNPNPNYSAELGLGNTEDRWSRANLPQVTPSGRARYSDSAMFSRVSRRSSSGGLQEPQSRTGFSPQPSSPAQTPGVGLTRGGFMSIYDHVNSPLKKAVSMEDVQGNSIASPRNSREMAAMEQRDLANHMVRQRSPEKDHRRATTQFGRFEEAQPSSINPFSGSRPRHLQERFPSMR